MAQLDIQGFVTPEQQFAGVYKLGETLAAQQAAKQKEQAAKDANKKLLNKVVADIDPKDFISNTIIDGKTSQDIYNLKGKAANTIKANPNMEQSELDSLLLPEVSKYAKRVQNAKEVDRQLKKGAEEMKGTAGFDAGKYFEEGKKYFLNPDGSVREDIENIDPSRNYYQEIMNNGNVWTSDAIHSILKEVPAAPETKTLDVRDAKGNRRKTMQELTYNTTFYQPKFNGTDFEGFEPETIKALDANGDVIIDKKTNQPVPILGNNSYDFLINKPQSKGYIEQRKREIAKQYNLDPNSTQVENAVRVELRDLVDTSPYKKASSKELKQDLAPVVKNYIGGSGGSKEPTINEVYDRLFTYTKTKLEEYKNNPQKFGKKDYVQVNLLDTDLRNVVLKEARNAEGDQALGIRDIKIKLDENGTMGVYGAKKGNLIGTLTPQGINVPATPKATGKEEEIKTVPKLSEYGTADQAAIKAFMKANKLGEQEAIRILIEKRGLRK